MIPGPGPHIPVTAAQAPQWHLFKQYYLSRDRRFLTMWYVRPAKAQTSCAYAQSDQNLCLSLEYYVNIKLLNEHNLEFLSLKEGYTGSFESIHVKMPHCWKPHVAAHLSLKTSCILKESSNAYSKQFTTKA